MFKLDNRLNESCYMYYLKFSNFINNYAIFSASLTFIFIVITEVFTFLFNKEFMFMLYCCFISSVISSIWSVLFIFVAIIDKIISFLKKYKSDF